VRPLHDLRHTSITHHAAINSNQFAVKTAAGHKDLSMTALYVHLASETFPDAAEALERRFVGRKFYPSDNTSDDLQHPKPLNHSIEGVVDMRTRNHLFG
jgi:hypothetical protein